MRITLSRSVAATVAVAFAASFVVRVGAARAQTADELRLAAVMKGCKYGCDELTYAKMKTLIGGGVDPNARIAGESPFLYTAVVCQFPVDVVEALIRAGADVNSAVPLPLLHAAVQTAATNSVAGVPAVKALIRGGARVNVLDGNGYTPLMEAARVSAPSTLLVDLLRSGADPGVVGRDGTTALTLARKSLHELEATANPNETPAMKETLAMMIRERRAAVKVLEDAASSENRR